MDEKILIESHPKKLPKKIMHIISSVLTGSSALYLLLMLFLRIPEYSYSPRWGINYEKIIGYNNAYQAAFADTHPDLFLPWRITFIIAVSILPLGIIATIIYLAHKSCSLTITDKNVKGKTLFGKEVVLPLYMVSAYSTTKFFSTISIATSSGMTKFSLIENYKEIGDILSGLINERQANTTVENNTTASGEKSTVSSEMDAMDKVLKLKSLLDAGAITEEEYEKKKKELLGL